MAQTLFRVGPTSQFVFDAISSLGGNGLITLYLPAGCAASNYQTLFRDITAAAYTVTSGKTLYIVACAMNAAAGGNFNNLGNGTSSVSNSASPPTSNHNICGIGAGVTVNQTFVIPLWVGIPSLTLPYVQQGATVVSNAVFWCFEQ